MRPDISNEQANYKLPGLQHKYDQTLVVISSEDCYDVCDWCFRGRIFCGKRLESDTVAAAGDVISYAQEHKEIRSVLFTGGDSFMADKDHMIKLVTGMNKAKHITSYRFGTRAMVHDPSIYNDMAPVFEAVSPDKTVYVVIHIVHPGEVTDELAAITKRSEHVYLSQTPLLAGINDSPKLLADMFHRLEWARINPYYVFHCRATEGNEKFVMTLGEGYRIVEAAKKRLSGVVKRFKYAMSCDEGKLEIVGMDEDDVLLKYHQARDREDLGTVKRIDANAVWLVDGEPMYLSEDSEYYLESDLVI